ncbi:ABC transporter permease [Paenibacillus sp. 481]|uniref:ABC transporter permease n=1 Tax=Paenibacillus sp. 481 TaxID=2835869 RepID=UPI001E4B2027|nr:ABC transporter permease [Paenibacillus sp. 481]UHA72835.1 ABC transporter permease [Paenibacillus sp. 481]
MTSRQLAISNIKGSWHRYSAYFFSSVFAVMIFFVYAAFIYHPDVMKGNIYGGSSVRQLMLLCQWLVIIFSFFFTLYSSGAFLKSRQKEFGMLTLFGMTKFQLRKLVFYENMIISLLSIVAGIGIGTLLTKLFLMTVSRMLGLAAPMRFYIDIQAVIITVVGYLLLFMCITLYSLRKVGRAQIIDLIRAEKAPRKVPTFSWLLVILAVVSLVAGYYLAVTSTMELFIVTAIPTIGFTVLGTYFLFTQLSVSITRMMQNNKRFYYFRTNMLNVSQVAYKLRDNAQMLFNISILCAVVLTATATVYSLDQGLRKSVSEQYLFVFVMNGGKEDVPPLSPKVVEGYANEAGHAVTASLKLKYVDGVIKPDNNRVNIISVADYNRLAVHFGYPTRSVASGESFLVSRPHNESMIFFHDPSQSIKLSPNKYVVSVKGHTDTILYVKDQLEQKVIPSDSHSRATLVVTDQLAAQLYASAHSNYARMMYYMDWEDWEYAMPVINKIESTLSEDNEYNVASRTEAWNSVKQITSLTLFIGLFISLLFFLASGSVIYFKLFTDLQDDQAYFKSLTRIGLSIEEIRKVVTFQVGLVFFAPCVVGSLHTMFAMKSLSNLLNSNVLGYALTVVALFVIMQTIYFLAARRTYMKKILEVADV